MSNLLENVDATSDSKIENEVGAATDGSKEESGGVVFASMEGVVNDKDEHVVLDGKGKGVVDECDRDFNGNYLCSFWY